MTFLIADDEGKIIAHDGGWLASGPSVRWRDAILANRAPADMMGELEAEDPALAAVVRERQLTFLVDRGGRQVLTWRGTPRYPDAAAIDTLALAPNGSEPPVLQRLLDAYQARIRRATLRETLDATRALYAAVYAHCGPDGSVSPLLQVGLVWQDDRRELLGPFDVTPGGT